MRHYGSSQYHNSNINVEKSFPPYLAAARIGTTEPLHIAVQQSGEATGGAPAARAEGALARTGRSGVVPCNVPLRWGSRLDGHIPFHSRLSETTRPRFSFVLALPRKCGCPLGPVSVQTMPYTPLSENLPHMSPSLQPNAQCLYLQTRCLRRQQCRQKSELRVFPLSILLLLSKKRQKIGKMCFATEFPSPDPRAHPGSLPAGGQVDRRHAPTPRTHLTSSSA